MCIVTCSVQEFYKVARSALVGSEPIVCGNITLGCIRRSEKGKAYCEDGTCPGNAGGG